MAKLQRYNSIANWGPIDSYYGKKIEGLHIKDSSFTRTFCRCGNTENKLIAKCPKCNNYVFEDGERDNKNNTCFPVIQDKVIEKDYIYIYKKDMCFSEGSDGVVSFNLRKFTSLKLSLDTLEFTPNYSKSIFTYFEENNLIDIIEDKSLFSYEDLIKKYSFFIYEDYPLLTKIIMAYSLNANSSLFVNDKMCYKYPYLAKAIAGDYINYLESMKNDYYYWYRRSNRTVCSNRNFLENINRNLRPQIDLLENICKYCFDNLELESIDNSLGTISYRNIFEMRNNSFNDFLKNIKEDKTGKEELLYYYVSNGLLSFGEANEIIKKFNTINDRTLDMKGFEDSWKFYKPDKPSWWEIKNCNGRISFRDFLEDEYLEFFDIYLKENIIVKKNHFVEGFIEQIYDMIQYKVPIKEENFKLKTYNYLLNTFKLAEVYKLPQERINLFLDMFEVNPLEAISLIKNRRKITDKEIDNFLKKIK